MTLSWLGTLAEPNEVSAKMKKNTKKEVTRNEAEGRKGTDIVRIMVQFTGLGQRKKRVVDVCYYCL